MLVYIPFIYFSTWLIIHLYFSNSRFGAGAMSILWIDINAFFAILLDARNLYGEFGCNPYAISLSGIVIYCICWTIALYPLVALDKQPFEHIPKNKSWLFSALCYIFIFSMILHLAFIDVHAIINGFKMDSSEAYRNAMDAETYQGGGGNIHMWIPNIISSFDSLYLIFWFISLTICKQNRFIRIGLFLSSMMAMVSGFSSGGRAQLLWWFITFLTYFCLFKPTLTKQQIKTFMVLLISIGSIITTAFLVITLSRFDSGNSQAIDSVIGYAGQQINNFCTIIPYAKTGATYPGHIFPLYSYIVKDIPFRLQDYHAIIADVFPYQINVFFTFFGDLLHDIGIVGLCMFMFIYLFVSKKIMSQTDRRSFTFAQMLIVSIIIRFPVEGLFSWPFVHYRHSLFILFTFGLFLIFQYTYKFGNKKIL